MPERFVLIHGDPVDGFVYVGPFDDIHAAQAYGECRVCNCDWWIADLKPGDEDQDI